MSKQFVGRINEVRQLKEHLASKSAEFIAIYGRRRVGKTFFVRQVVGHFAFALSGLENANLSDQLLNFHIEMKKMARIPDGFIRFVSVLAIEQPFLGNFLAYTFFLRI